jgi:hypothetical protein
LASVSVPTATIFAVHSAVLGESIRADSGSIGLFFLILGLWLPSRQPKYKRLVPACLALSVAVLPGYLLVVIPILALYRHKFLPDRRSLIWAVGLAALLLADRLIAPASTAQGWLADSNLPAGWWTAAAVTQQAGLLKEFGRLPLVADVLILLAAMAGLALASRRLAALAGLAGLAVLLVPMGYRPWFVICGPLLACLAGRSFEFVARHILLTRPSMISDQLRE